MKKSGWAVVNDRHGIDLEINDWVRLTHNEYHSGRQYSAGQTARVADFIMDGNGIRVEVELQKTRIIVPSNRLLFEGTIILVF